MKDNNILASLKKYWIQSMESKDFSAVDSLNMSFPFRYESMNFSLECMNGRQLLIIVTCDLLSDVTYIKEARESFYDTSSDIFGLMYYWICEKDDMNSSEYLEEEYRHGYSVIWKLIYEKLKELEFEYDVTSDINIDEILMQIIK